ncbi:hypothetical protein CEXT_329741 [Caerostris extrusa]|uniref:Uncharacterized protein n=1 Tax=Caerostris extrusa TaxID=172846 RepID=A0AAV4Q0Q3_CAEEX|nr:hypothetical protein CEXT_329741 [Caerostris extrusa]
MVRDGQTLEIPADSFILALTRKGLLSGLGACRTTQCPTPELFLLTSIEISAFIKAAHEKFSLPVTVPFINQA